MKSKAWIVVAKILAVITALYGVLLITVVFDEISKYNSHAEMYTNGMQGVLWTKKLEILYILLSIPGAVLFFFHSKTGWAMQAAMQTLLLLVIVAVVSFVGGGGKTNGSVLATVVFIIVPILCLTGLFAMFSPAVRNRFSVGAVQYILALIFVGLFVAAYYA